MQRVAKEAWQLPLSRRLGEGSNPKGSPPELLRVVITGKVDDKGSGRDGYKQVAKKKLTPAPDQKLVDETVTKGAGMILGSLNSRLIPIANCKLNNVALGRYGHGSARIERQQVPRVPAVLDDQLCTWEPLGVALIGHCSSMGR
jgi:hypothetical protein